MKYNKMLRYKACRNSIVTLELLNNTKTNEKRSNVVNDKYANFRCNMAKVVNITNVKTGALMENDVSFYNDEFKYRLGEVVKTSFHEIHLNAVCTKGIHYFKTKKVAVSWFYTMNDLNFPDGNWIMYYENGQKQSEGTYKNGEKDGKWIDWYENGQIESEGTYKDGERNGKWIGWHDNSNKDFEGTYKNRTLDGKMIEWWNNGYKKSEGTYKDWEKIGEWVYWDIDGNKMENGYFWM